MLNNESRTIIAVTLIILAALLGAGYHWGSVQIIADSTPPTINTAYCTSGDLVYGSGKPKLTMLFTENVGVQSATATVYNVGTLGTLGDMIEEVTLTETAVNGDQYQYDGRTTKTLEANKEYFVVYQVTDTAGHTDTYGKDALGRGTVKIRLVQVEATCYINDIEVRNTYDQIHIDTLDLAFRVEIHTGSADDIDTIYAVIGTEKVDFMRSGTEWVGFYTLPEDGSYSVMVNLVDQGGAKTRLASFNITLGTRYQTPIVVGTLTVLLVGIIWYGLDQPKKAKGR